MGALRRKFGGLFAKKIGKKLFLCLCFKLTPFHQNTKISASNLQPPPSNQDK